MTTKKKNTVKDVKTILNDSKLQNYNTNFTISKKRNGGSGGHRGNGTKQPTTKQILLDFIKEQRRFNNKVDVQFGTINDQFKAHGWTK